MRVGCDVYQFLVSVSRREADWFFSPYQWQVMQVSFDRIARSGGNERVGTQLLIDALQPVTNLSTTLGGDKKYSAAPDNFATGERQSRGDAASEIKGREGLARAPL